MIICLSPVMTHIIGDIQQCVEEEDASTTVYFTHHEAMNFDAIGLVDRMPVYDTHTQQVIGHVSQKYIRTRDARLGIVVDLVAGQGALVAELKQGVVWCFCSTVLMERKGCHYSKKKLERIAIGRAQDTGTHEDPFRVYLADGRYMCFIYVSCSMHSHEELSSASLVPCRQKVLLGMEQGGW